MELKKGRSFARESYYGNKQSFISKCILHLAIIELLISSGASYIINTFLGNGSVTVSVYVLTCLLYYITKDNVKISQNNRKKFLFITIWIITVTVIFGQGNHNSLFLTFILYAFGTLLLLSSTDFLIFRKLLLIYLSILSIISILVLLGHDYFGLFPSKPFVYPGGDVANYSYVFNMNALISKSENSHRLASIYWEPGQYQIVILFVMGLFADEWSDIKEWKRNVKKFGILVMALLMTISTMAYLMLMLMLIIIFVRVGVKQFKYLAVYLLLGLAAFSYLYNSDAIQNKIEEREDDNQESSYVIRMGDNLGCLMVTLEDPLTGFGIGSSVLESRLFSQGSITSSNGWLYGSAQLGIPYIIFLWLCMWKNLKRMNPHTNTFLMFLLLVITQSNEAIIYFPYIFMYVFSFPKPKVDIKRL